MKSFGCNRVESHPLTLRALCPDLVEFSYIPKNDLLIHGSDKPMAGAGRAAAPDYSEFGTSQLQDSQDHVLVLEFKDSVRGRKGDNQ